ncbi:23S rRNA pseudouridine(1911/1915/1917) synthase RluD [Pseudohaliea sp.]|uniref:23S rRNA pseudouridine(1911/1915/1917) synthase RluD n=1 Tax=Pseudohaliea sp. TaxID=2740289 RepID=UPI0032ECCFF5
MPERIELSATVGQSEAGERLDQAAARLFPDYSRARLQGWIKAGELRVDGEQRRPRDRVAAGEVLTVAAEQAEAVSWAPQAIALDIIHEDEHIIVIDKPAGLVVHPAAGHGDGTLVNALLAHAPGMASLPRGGIVHRLDKDTSGLLVAAKTLPAHRSLVEQLQARSVGREYLALCFGALTGGGTVDAPIGRHPRQRKKMAVVNHGGKTAVTHYRIAERFRHYTLLRVKLETGRTHQIRVHLAHRHHPLVGDPVYGGRLRLPAGASETLIEALRGFRRQALHARALELLHPATGEAMAFECPLAADFADLLAVLRREDPAKARKGA